MKQRIYDIIEKAEDGDKYSKIFDYFLMTVIFLTILGIIFESYDSIATQYKTALRVFEIVSVVIFTIEYILRIWTADLKYPVKSKIAARLAFMITFMALVDLFAIMPFYLPMIIPIDLRFLWVLRLLRLFRVFKFNRYSSALKLISKVVKRKKEELIATVFIMVFIIMISSTLIYYMENAVQPNKFPNIVASFWWAIATLTTVGYGDIYPITAIGKIFASVIAISGIGLVALRTGIISSGFMSEMKRDKIRTCPNCGERIDIEE